MVYVYFAAVLCRELDETCRVGYRIGQLGLKMLNQKNDRSNMPLVHLLYYGWVGILFEPIQACVEMHRQAYDVGLQTGNLSIAGMHKTFAIAREFYTGVNLVRIKDEIECVSKSQEYYGSMSVAGVKLGVQNMVVKCLIDGESSGTKSEDGSDNDPTVVYAQMIISVYCGYFERAKHLAKRWEKIHCKEIFSLRVVFVQFYWGLASLVVARRKATKQVLSDIDRYISIVENAAGFCMWNFRNKVALLKALRHSLRSQNAEAEGEISIHIVFFLKYGFFLTIVDHCFHFTEATFQIAVDLSQASKFVHEEGLCHELAGMHHEELGEFQHALNSYRQAEKCYSTWGSQMKVNKTKDKILHVSHELVSYNMLCST